MIRPLLVFYASTLLIGASCSGNSRSDTSTEAEVDPNEDADLDLAEEEEEGDRTTYCSAWEVPDEALAYGALSEHTGPSNQQESIRLAVLGGEFWALTVNTSTGEKALYNITDVESREIPVAYENPAGDHCSGLVNDLLATETHFILLYSTCASILTTEGLESDYIDITGGTEGWTRGHDSHFVDSEVDITVVSKVTPELDTEGLLTFRLNTDATRINDGEYIVTHSAGDTGWRIDQYPVNSAVKTSERLFIGFYGPNSSTPESDHDVVYFAQNLDGTLYSNLFKIPTTEYYLDAVLRFVVRAGTGTVIGWTSFTGPDTTPLQHLIYIDEDASSASDLEGEVLIASGSDAMEAISTYDRNSFILLTGSALPSIDHCIDFYLTTGWQPTSMESGPESTLEVGGGIGFMDRVHTARMAVKSDSILIVWNDYWNFDESPDFYTATNYLVYPTE